MRGIFVERKSCSPVSDRVRLADVGKTILCAIAGAIVGMGFGAIYGSFVTILFGAMAGAIAAMIANEVDWDDPN